MSIRKKKTETLRQFAERALKHYYNIVDISPDKEHQTVEIRGWRYMLPQYESAVAVYGKRTLPAWAKRPLMDGNVFLWSNIPPWVKALTLTGAVRELLSDNATRHALEAKYAQPSLPF